MVGGRRDTVTRNRKVSDGFFHTSTLPPAEACPSVARSLTAPQTVPLQLSGVQVRYLRVYVSPLRRYAHIMFADATFYAGMFSSECLY